jgi:hypothetical protein
MMILNRNGSLEWIPLGGDTAGSTRGSIDLPADLVAAQPDLLDRVFALAFDVLGLVTIDLRIRASGPEPRAEPISVILKQKEQPQ